VEYPAALPHGDLTPVFDGIYFVCGAMETVLMELDWTFSRNMTVVKQGDKLIVINSVRLDAAGLAALDALGTVTDIVRIGAMHGRDDPFYVQHYQANYWALPGLEHDSGLPVTHRLTIDTLPIDGARIITFPSAKQVQDFEHLLTLPFKHALCGHGEPLRDTAHEAYSATVAERFSAAT